MSASGISNIAVVGAGLMGHGIALQFALGGFEVRLNDVSEKTLERARVSVQASLDLLQGLGVVDAEAARQAPRRIRDSTSLGDSLAGVDFVVEAVFEDLALKQNVFDQLDRLAPGHAILASNTSSFMSSQLAPATARPDKVLVANWWNPPYLLPLVEVVPGPATSDDTTEATRGLLTRVGKRPVVLRKESLGFIGNRMQFALLREAISIVDQGIASAEDVDTVVKSSFGRRLAVAGPLEVFDIAGWDTILAIIEQLFPEIDSSREAPSLVRGMVDRGELGVKSGRGFYPWSDESVAETRQRIGKTLATLERLSGEA